MTSSSRYLTSTALIVALGGFLMGFDVSVVSGVVRFVEAEFALGPLQLGWVVSSLSLTAAAMMITSAWRKCSPTAVRISWAVSTW